MRKKSNRWIVIKGSQYFDSKINKYRVPVMYFKTLQEVADFFCLPSKQYVNDIMHGRRDWAGVGTRVDLFSAPKYINKDLTLQELEDSVKWKTEYKKQILEKVEKRNARKELIENYRMGKLPYWKERVTLYQLYTDSYIDVLEREYQKLCYDMYQKILNDYDILNFNNYIKQQKGEQLTRTELYRTKRWQMLYQQMELHTKKYVDGAIKETQKALMLNYKEVSNAIKGPAEMFFQMDERKLKTLVNEVWCADNKSWSQRIWKNTDRLKYVLKEQLAEGIIKGEHSSKIAKRIQEAMNASYSNAKRLASTELAHIETIASQDRYKEYGIEEWKILATHDEKTCPICSSRDGEQHSINEAPVPLHPRCRCTMIPVVEF